MLRNTPFSHEMGTYKKTVLRVRVDLGWTVACGFLGLLVVRYEVGINKFYGGGCYTWMQ